MGTVVEFHSERDVRLVDEEYPTLQPGSIIVETITSGVSAGTELTAYRGTNPYLTRQWDVESRLFRIAEPSFAYPVRGWGYSEVGRIVEVADDVTSLSVGDTVWGIWGHRSHARLLATALDSHVLPPNVPTDAGTFARVGAIAYNAMLASGVRLGDTVMISGQGVIGLLCTQLLALAGARVIAVDLDDSRLETALTLGAWKTLNAKSDNIDGIGADVRDILGGAAADCSIDFSGNYAALHEAIRSVKPGGRVVASGFYQGEAHDLRLGEEFHHNRIELISSQIGGVPSELSSRWTVDRLQREYMNLVVAGKIAPHELITHRFKAAEVAEAFDLIDTHRSPLQVVLDFSTGGTPA
jgi:2-desacetyl-2-hydroxyethyl bacteriochlorophyllide A dehydrogenase